MPFLSNRVAAGAVKLSRGGHPAALVDIVRAQADGAAAFHSGTTAGDCPYVADHSDRGRFLALMWFRAFRTEQQGKLFGAAGNE